MVCFVKLKYMKLSGDIIFRIICGVIISPNSSQERKAKVQSAERMVHSINTGFMRQVSGTRGQ
jgi:hypothetical protein